MENKYDEIVTCVGAGYVGGPTMAVLAQHCLNSKFYVVDIDQKRIDAWNSKDLPIYEPGLQAVVEETRNRNLFFTTEVSRCIKESGIIFIAVNTGTKYYGEGKDCIYDISAFEAVARTIAKEADDDKIVIEKSTVPVGTADKLKQILDLVAANRAKKNNTKKPKFEIISNPEFLAEGCAIRDLQDPHRVILGSDKTETGLNAVERVAKLYRKWIPNEKIITINTFSSELTKLAGNAFLAQRISSINSLSVLCQKTGADIAEVSHGLGKDARIGPHFLQASLGFGGSCFKKDILGLTYICESLNLPLIAEYWRMVVTMNDYQTNTFCKRIYATMFNNLRGKTIFILGFAFKANTGDIRESPAIHVARYLLEEKANVVIYDPQVKDTEIKELFPAAKVVHDPVSGAKGAQAIVVCTEWPIFKTYDYAAMYEHMEHPTFLFDGRNILDSKKLEEIGFIVRVLGK